MDTINRKHRWLQFSLRSLLVLIALACVIIACAGLKIRSMLDEAAKEAERQAKNREMYARLDRGSRLIEGLGGSLCGNSDWAPGQAYVGFNKHFSNDELKKLIAIPEIGYLNLSRTQVTDRGLAHLKGMTQLKELYLSDTQITDMGLKELKGLTALELLELDGTQVTDSGVSKLQMALPKCEIDH